MTQGHPTRSRRAKSRRGDGANSKNLSQDTHAPAHAKGVRQNRAQETHKPRTTAPHAQAGVSVPENPHQSMTRKPGKSGELSTPKTAWTQRRNWPKRGLIQPASRVTFHAEPAGRHKPPFSKTTTKLVSRREGPVCDKAEREPTVTAIVGSYDPTRQQQKPRNTFIRRGTYTGTGSQGSSYKRYESYSK